ncbi:hypothetical protein GCM10009727_89750 [Actinomadura napierensis]|uniref:Uncharacterized protein n=1 Tax=Actinomadura napierensis TaxID=267854 RepID=A0ABN3AID2_9ACTN
MALTDPPRDQLRVLRAEVDDENGVKGLVYGHQHAFRTGLERPPVYGAPSRADARARVTPVTLGDWPKTVGIRLP